MVDRKSEDAVSTLLYRANQQTIMRFIHYLLIALPISIVLDMSIFIADYLEKTWSQYKNGGINH